VAGPRHSPESVFHQDNKQQGPLFWRKNLHLADLVPDTDVLVALESDELGLHILQVLAVWPAHLGSPEMRTFVSGALQGFGPSPRTQEAEQAIREAWAWLEGQALLIQDPRILRGEGRVLSRKGRRLGQDVKARRAFSGHRLAKEALHPSIREDVWSLYQREKYDTAVFEAMKAVEVSVRDAAALQPTDLGAPLMRKAFDADSGALTDMTAVVSERQALSGLFAGAIGAYKNPHSHRNVALDDPDEAAEIILLANHLLRIVDVRRPYRR
jgi:uncharacterized protein (TIGR02391 family)